MSYRHFIAPLVVALLAPPSLTVAGDEPPQAAEAKKAVKSRPAKAGGQKDEADKARDKAFRLVQRSALAQMKSKKDDQRLLAFERLKEFPTSECAKLLVQQGLASKYDEVRKEAYATLASFRDSSEVCDYLLASVEKESAKGMPNEVRCAIFAVPLSSSEPEIEKKALALFDKEAGQRKGGLLLLVSLADLLGTLGSDESISTLLKLSQRPAFDEHFGVRRSIVQALMKIEEKDAIDALLAILAKTKGEVRGDIVQHLTGISGQQLGLDPPAWAAWWKAARENFRFLPIAARAVNRAEAVRSQSMYYGMPIYAVKLVFVIDTSGSMRGQRIYAAKRELISAINALPEGVSFDVLAFDHSVRHWQKKLSVASADNKGKAVKWVEAQGLGRATASYDALEAALDFDAESVFFLTDGAPRGGKVVEPEEIVEVLTRINFTRRVTINTIGIGVGPALPTNPFHAFLSSLAERNYGEYRAVNE